MPNRDISDPKAAKLAAADSTSEAASDELKQLVRSKIAQTPLISGVSAAKNPGARELVSAVGGIRGLIESLIPGLVFLVAYLLSSGNLWISVTIPVAVALAFIIGRLVTKTELLSAISGFAGLVVSALIAIFSGNLENNFLTGLVVNSIMVVVFTVSVLARYPLVGLVASIFFEREDWRSDKRIIRLTSIASLIWAAIAAIRLAVQLPLYFNSEIGWLATARLALGVTLTVVALWTSWLLIRAAFIRE